ncbi:MAG: translational GTPase TypA, partial [Bdellovibrionales bacterium]|nr:translational GTPase TypA [Bdellovibrionales bacterium]
MDQNTAVRNIAIIAHVDHGKTTLVDQMFRQSGAIERDDTDRIMDSMDLERERGITIAAKNCSVIWDGVKINILDTPGHADFGGEVERALMMVDGAILLVDAAEGPLPQTRFVLSKALQADLSIVVVINKIDRQDARPEEILNQIYDLFIDLDANDEQIDFPVLYAVGRDGTASTSLSERGSDLRPLLDTILDQVSPPRFDGEAPFQMLVSNLGYSDYLGRLAIGRVVNGTVKTGDALSCIGKDAQAHPVKVSSLQVYQGLSFKEVDALRAGDIAILSGADDVEIGDTICERSNPKALPRVSVDEPTISMRFSVNTSPLAGTEGRFVQSTKLAERLYKETLHNVALRVIPSTVDESFTVQGRGEFQMAILLESMRREGFEVSVGRPQIIFKQQGEQVLEPIEHLFIDCDEGYTGIVTEKRSLRKGRMVNLVNHGTGRVRLEFSIPSRGLIGYRSQFLTDTRGTGIMNALLEGYEPHRGDIASRTTGSLVSDRAGETVPYALFNLEPRGELCVGPGEKVYEGMIVGEHNRDNDLNVNPCKTKKLSNMRA